MGIPNNTKPAFFKTCKLNENIFDNKLLRQICIGQLTYSKDDHGKIKDVGPLNGRRSQEGEKERSIESFTKVIYQFQTDFLQICYIPVHYSP